MNNRERLDQLEKQLRTIYANDMEKNERKLEKSHQQLKDLAKKYCNDTNRLDLPTGSLEIDSLIDMVGNHHQLYRVIKFGESVSAGGIRHVEKKPKKKQIERLIRDLRENEKNEEKVFREVEDLFSKCNKKNDVELNERVGSICRNIRTNWEYTKNALLIELNALFVQEQISEKNNDSSSSDEDTSSDDSFSSDEEKTYKNKNNQSRSRASKQY